MSLARLLQSRKVANSTSSNNPNEEYSFDSTSEHMLDNREIDYFYGSGDERSLGSCMTLSENVSRKRFPLTF